ncbi:acyl carrier protein [Streptomyces sp. CB00316]|uniref:acyl carrier protein n=1 Tax=Streptomyces TaxID=1883 RepID=UPI000939E2C7|nr:MULTISPECIES: acyl carrier protein [unclassified Streptomyces]MCD9904429.1 acyl carrier protein [Streptomyces sp. MT29]MBT2381560.1 acyl carrier protein [Streptomyces sp. ISL-111]MBT2429041.1 acyl carrier protein [Streptomyces sp. ISL-112]MBT2464061.1 acyl carrier protein [Streptomyces sp. ISL-63]OKJ20025.1 acyl carrier protein [Streptomyces sp. CB00316]
MSDTYPRLVQLLVKNFGFETDEVAPEDTFNKLELDSLALVELTLTVQQEFGVKLSDDDLGAEDTLGQAVSVIESKLVVA